MRAPLVSIVLPVHNAEKDLPRAVESLLRQTFVDFEIVALDDGSADRSGELLEQYARRDTRLRVFHEPKAAEFSQVLNQAVDLARGTYIARQDADDASTAGRLALQVQYLERHAAVGLCGTWTWFIDDELGPCFSYELPDDHKLMVAYMENGFNPIVHGSVMFRKTVFEKSGGYRGAYSEDFDLWLRFSEATRLGMSQALGYYYWRSVGGVSSGAIRRQKYLTGIARQLHEERMRYGREITDPAEAYRTAMTLNASETRAAEREATMRYARGIHLLLLGRRNETLSQFKQASTGEGPYAAKARRHIRLFFLWPLIRLVYRALRLREPFRHSRLLDIKASLPDELRLNR